MNPLAVLALGALLAGQSAGTVHIRDVAPEHYPDIGAVVRVTDAAGRDVPGLGTAEFRVLEDGQPVQGLDVRPSYREGGSLAVELLIDTSGSMSGGPIESAKGAARAFLDRLGPDDRVGLISFGAPEVERAPIGPASAITGLEQLSASGFTALYGAVSLAIARLASQPAKARAIIVLTDGHDDEGDDRSRERFDRLRQALTGSAIPIHAVGFRSGDFDPDPLRDLASITNGTYRDTESPGEFAALYGQIADVLLPEYRIIYKSSATTGAHRLRIEVRTPTISAVGEQRFDVIGGGTPPLTAEPDDGGGGAPAPALVAVAVSVLAVAGMIVFLIRRRQHPVESVRDVVDGESPPSRLVLVGPGLSIPVATGSMLVGRDPSAQVIVDDPLVSRQHARLQATADGLVVEDLGSSNGTLVNGEAITTGFMRPGDVLEIGDLRLYLRENSS